MSEHEPLVGPNPPSRLLLGSGPSNVSPRVYRAMMTPVIGYLDPDFLRRLDEATAARRPILRWRPTVP